MNVITIEECVRGGYLVRVDGIVEGVCFTRWGARFAAWRIQRRLQRGLRKETIR